MNCKQFEKLLGRYMDGDLDHASAEAMRAHMAQCPPCAREFAMLKKITGGLSQMGDAPLPAGFEQRWKQAVRSAPSPRKKAAFGKLLPGLAAGVAAIVVISTVFASGMLNPALSARDLSAQPARNGMMAGGAGKAESASLADSAEAGSAMMAPAPESQASATPELPEAAAAPAESAAPDMSAQFKMAVEEDSAVISVQVEPDTLENLETYLKTVESVYIEFTRSGSHLTITITDQNQAAVADFTKEAGLEVNPQPGETYDFYSGQ